MHRPGSNGVNSLDIFYQFIQNFCSLSCWYNDNQTVSDEVAHSKNPRKCTYHVTFDLDLDLEHTLDAGLPDDHRVQVWSQSGHLLGEEAFFVPAQKCPYDVTFDLHLVKVWWRSGHLPARRSDLRKSLQTDGQTDRRRTPRHCISSFLE